MRWSRDVFFGRPAWNPLHLKYDFFLLQQGLVLFPPLAVFFTPPPFFPFRRIKDPPTFPGVTSGILSPLFPPCLVYLTSSRHPNRGPTIRPLAPAPTSIPALQDDHHPSSMPLFPKSIFALSSHVVLVHSHSLSYSTDNNNLLHPPLACVSCSVKGRLTFFYGQSC